MDRKIRFLIKTRQEDVGKEKREKTQREREKKIKTQSKEKRNHPFTASELKMKSMVCNNYRADERKKKEKKKKKVIYLDLLPLEPN